ncbi:HAMP domain-containing histidine kinase [Nonomuraea fuscirosea]|uniref:sensor histidine kinase n=1 Tax=Nonomuraea fuscirosea TaxID=1291556 RepID=UPI002DD7A892|nr:HAMP domain-containing sensor histidine kinase [Nonomuraea fuscirosea]WSA50024.1 HAMP domain-containing histidine kinase [Nonomuraea fuscirosea]
MTAHPAPLYDDEAVRPSGAGSALPAFRTTGDTVRELKRELRKRRRFASDASHELRTAVAGLRVELEEAGLHPDETDLGGLLVRALRGIDRLDAILTDLRVLAEMEGGAPVRPEQVDVAGLVREEIGRRTDRTAVRLRLEPGVHVEAVPIRIIRVLNNLLDNAQRHCRQLVEVRVCREDGHAVLTVTDDGEGVAEPDREQIFQRFTRLEAARHRDRSGTGLGLAIARDIAQAHGGSLHAAVAETGGASFVLRLPLAGRDEGHRAPEAMSP